MKPKAEDSGPPGLWNDYGVTPSPVDDLTAKFLEWLGLHVTPIRKEQFRGANVVSPYARGLDVTFSRGSAYTDIQEGDIIVSFDGHLLHGLDALDHAVRSELDGLVHGVEEVLRFTLLRNGTTVEVEVNPQPQVREWFAEELRRQPDHDATDEPRSDASASSEAEAAEPEPNGSERDDSASDESDPFDDPRLYGIWQVEEGSAGGEAMGFDEPVMMVFERGRYERWIGGNLERQGTLLLNPHLDPSMFILMYNDGLKSVVDAEGIYRFDGDRLTIALHPGSGKRPTEFLRDLGNPQSQLLTLRRHGGEKPTADGRPAKP